MTAMRLKRYPSSSGGFALGKMGVGATMLNGWKNPYITDGLIAMWDGEWNVGGGVHDPNATTWKNLTGDTAWDMVVPAAWQNDGLYFDGTWCAKAPQTSEVAVTIECVSDKVQAGFPLAFGWSKQNEVKRYSLLRNESTKLMRSYIIQPFDGQYDSAYRYAALTVSESNSSIYGNGVLNTSSSTQIGVTGTTPNRFRLGGYDSPFDADVAGIFYKGHIHRCSIYSRALTAAEIAANYAIDKERFNLP